ncbi:NAD(P)H-quinone oxidoreductase [Frigoribacterium sp. CG_9.8]|uniref:NAD(P)H-quinone oxidoreductase n=1 Tax=Frigoribacterium sp. CG_9.8 TaxID=2787733 RepID=UPI0018C9EDBA|nr:NAD(P)H-quinone oxidoreductase [Frigoribacterium sp. CG_9.8]MBG6107310.1 putative PIG3 family NAD(P)H quinone oxidoreductase [Frigoribacterium sp. CG_9.8]
MHAITVPSPGGVDALVYTRLPDVSPGHGEVLIDVAAAGVNRADVSQREGHYPPPPGASPLPGMEVSGIIRSLGTGVNDWAVGDRVCALLPGGGYASLAVAAAGQLLPVPDSLDLVDAAGLPEAIATVWSNVFLTAGLRSGETLLVHGGSSGIGTIAIQLARAFGSLVAVTAGSSAKLAACERLGAEILIDYRQSDFAHELITATEGRGVDVILDSIGGAYLDRNLRSLAPHGRLVNVGNLSGETGTLDFALVMRRWLSIHGSTLRARTAAEKDEIVASVRKNVWPLVLSGQVHPVIDSRFALADAALAHHRMESSEHIGKLLLVP